MPRRIAALLTTVATILGIVLFLPASSASAADCAASWSSSAVYTGGMMASYSGHNWSAKWWTQNEIPGSADVWADQGACGGSTTPSPSGFVVSEAQFNQMFPSRNSFYTYSGLTAALSAYPAFATTGSDTVKKQEAAAFLANVSHETGGLVYIVEQNTANYSTYCDWSQWYGCPAGQSAYYGRGPIQLSWNFNYKAAGDALGIDLLDNPYLVQTDAAVAWKTGLWYWMTQSGPGTMTPHNAMVNGAGFGETIRSINGSLECNGLNTAEMQDRVNKYNAFVQILGTTAGSNLTC
ncbi:glycoside hydrolase family 19 protein [Actinacidiphila oryziradicis]|uniref:Chitinase n=2 Tax=Actinacidiphila oryziradicis TaxID=2571141 RepID=A0A4U0ST61_9ACTN|nr:glycoside hydrolase family 19 protein [Actinacidiphila oryziradicis]TKA13350.1 chitinase [Actinacidiphila oryziradicis]